jgi:hypothetical protein
MTMGNDFLNKHCKLVKSDGFVLYGIVREVTPMYVLLETSQRKSIIGFIEIRELSLDPQYYGAMI